MGRGRHYTVEATTPDGDVEFTGNYTSDACMGDVVKDMVGGYANHAGCMPQDVKVTDVWWVSEQ